MKRSAWYLAASALLLFPAAASLPTLDAGAPYTSYIDEVFFLRPTAALVRSGGWDPGWYMYPSLPLIATAAAARLYAPLYAARHGGRPLAADLRSDENFYGILEPFDFLRLGRVMSLLAVLGTVLTTSVLARRLAGDRAGLAAGLLTALAPPLAIRSGIATVDPYAMFFVLACLLAAESLARTQAPRPGGARAFAALAAGALAGLAGAAKYPAVLVALAPAVTILSSGSLGSLERPWREKARRLAILAAGAALGLVVGLPGLLFHPADVWDALRTQRRMYLSLPCFAPLWRQALVRAEWDLPYEHPELGAVFLLLTAAGLFAAFRDATTARAVRGWALYAGVTIVLVSLYPFQPFRNLLALVPLACILVALLYVRLRRRAARPLALDAALALLIISFVLPLAGFVRDRRRLVDSRTEAVDWLARRTAPGDRALALRDLAILPSELDRTGAWVTVRRWPLWHRAFAHGSFRFLIAGTPHADRPDGLPAAERQEILARYELRARFGDYPSPPGPGDWHSNRQNIYVLERR